MNPKLNYSQWNSGLTVKTSRETEEAEYEVFFKTCRCENHSDPDQLEQFEFVSSLSSLSDEGRCLQNKPGVSRFVVRRCCHQRAARLCVCCANNLNYSAAALFTFPKKAMLTLGLNSKWLNSVETFMVPRGWMNQHGLIYPFACLYFGFACETKSATKIEFNKAVERMWVWWGG